MTDQLSEVVTWVKVDPPTFDLAGILTSSLTFALIGVAVAFALGGLTGWLLILRNRRAAPELAPLELGIDPHQP